MTCFTMSKYSRCHVLLHFLSNLMYCCHVTILVKISGHLELLYWFLSAKFQMREKSLMHSKLLLQVCLFNISELSICTTDDSRIVGMPISFMCACIKFVISVSPSNSTARKGPDSRHGKDATFNVLLSQKPSVMQIKSSLFRYRALSQLVIRLSQAWWR